MILTVSRKLKLRVIEMNKAISAIIQNIVDDLKRTIAVAKFGFGENC